MTASYSLRNHAKIPRPTRERVQRAAKKIGYVPQPELGRLMHLLRAHRQPAYQATLAFLSFSHDADAARHLHRYTADVIAGARRRAAALGYAVDLFHIDSDRLSPDRLTAMLKSRGIRGVLILPLPMVEDCTQLLDWAHFAVVAATYSAQKLVVNRVVPHHQSNIALAIAKLQQRGCRRLGLVLTDELARRVNFAYEAAVSLHQQQGDLAPIPPLRLDSTDPARSADAIEPWLDKYRPDTLLTVENAAPLLQRVLAHRTKSSIALCLLDHSGEDPLPGIDQHPAIIGETAVDLLAGQVQRGEIGFGQHPRVTMVEGSWLWADAPHPARRRPG